ncbi:MAG TPA: hypothetical protein VLX92_12520, partial [Kofleriaceae bacterium]|nr:hypothetical protein [Kofleriaceae bacterium]
NTFMPDGQGGMTLTDPLLDLRFTQMELDFFAAVDDQYIRVFTVVADVHLPVGLQVTAMGELAPVIGDAMDAFTNISVKNSEAVTESPADLASLFPSILSLVLPQLSGGLPSIALPSLGGLDLDVTAITAVDNKTFLAIYANLVPATMARPVRTTVDVAAVTDADAQAAKDPTKWSSARPPSVTLALGGDQPDLEYSVRIDDGSWSAWSRNAHPTLAPRTFWLPGVHHAEVRARQIGHPETIDTDPPRIALPLGGAALANNANGFHGTSGTTGCTCNSGGGAGNAAPFALILAFVLLPLRRVRRRLARLGAVVWLTALACLPGCSCGSKPCGGSACMKGELPHSPGRWTSIAGDDKRVMVATYEEQLGDLVVADATDLSNLKLTVVDGIPSDTTPTYDPSTYRGGVADPGPNVGAWTSIAMTNHEARVAYQDRDMLALKYAYESGGKWGNYVVDPGNGENVGEFASMTIDGDGNPAIAYLAIGVDDGMGHKNTELRLARAATNEPSESDWTQTTMASAPGTCAGLCASGESCVQPATATDPQVCATATTDCNPGCGSGSTCVTGACLKDIVDPMVDDIPTGTGLFVSLVVLPDGRLAATYYDQTRRALVLGLESAKGSSTFAETVLDGNVAGQDRGMWSSAVVASDGTIHVAYQEALGDQLMYTTWNSTPGTPVVVDDGTRAGDRTHPVGAGNTIYLVNGTPTIAYQDGLDADVYIASGSGTTWTVMPFATGPMLDGFSIGATTAHGDPVLAWDARDPSQTPENTLVVQQP